MSKRKPYEYQKTAIKAGVKHFLSYALGQLIMFCRTGKTYVSMEIARKISIEIARRVLKKTFSPKLLVVCHSLHLVEQTLKEYLDHFPKQYEYLVVCSKKPIGDIYGVQVTTDPNDIISPLRSHKPLVIISTYHSLKRVASAIESSGKWIDFAIIDEAQFTTGDANKSWALAARQTAELQELENMKQTRETWEFAASDQLKARKKLFQTATPKDIIDISGSDSKFHSMNDESVYQHKYRSHPPTTYLHGFFGRVPYFHGFFSKN